jgi:hypothetical protein
VFSSEGKASETGFTVPPADGIVEVNPLGMAAGR